MPSPPPEAPLPLDPVLSLLVGDGSSSEDRKNLLGDKGRLSSVTGLCLVENPVCSSTRLRHASAATESSESDGESSEGAEEESDGDSDDDDDNEPTRFQCRQLARWTTQQQQPHNSLGLSLGERRGRCLVSCHANGESFVWDLERQRIQNEFCPPRGGPGLALRRMAAATHEDNDEDEKNNAPASHPRIMYQTRDPAGTVSVHQLMSDGRIVQLQTIITNSQSFCAASPCANHPHLLVVPDGDETAAVVRDVRMDPASPPAAIICTSKLTPPSSLSASPSMDRTYGMLTSLAFALASPSDNVSSTWPCEEVLRHGHGGSGRPVVACGMESGHVLLYDLAATSVFAQPVSVPSTLVPDDCTSTEALWLDKPSDMISLGKDPVLALDMVPSIFLAPQGTASLSMVIAAGMAGTLEDVAALDRPDQGRVALVKCRWTMDDSSWTTRIRSRLATCRVPNDDTANNLDWIGKGGKPGVSQCRFRPGSGRLLAVAGWDKRVRVFDRSAKASCSPSAALAVLRGHAATVTAIDWASDAEASGLLATGGNYGRIHLWKLDL